MLNQQIDIKVVSSNGQISIGKEYAGSQIQLIKQEDGTLLIKKGRFIPDNELWLYEKDNFQRISKSIEWSEKHERKENFEDIKSIIENEQDIT